MAASAQLSTAQDVVLVALGANLPSPHGGPRETCEAALAVLGERGVVPVRRSRWYRSAPVPPSDQPWFVNGVAAVGTALEPAPLLAVLLDVERCFGRTRGAPAAARILDLDLLDWRGVVRGGDTPPELPHPRMHERAFVLKPLAEVVPGWRHPRLGRTVEALIAALPPGQEAEPMA